MLIFLNDDAACRHWLVHHRQGYAVEGLRTRKSTGLTLHNARCAALRDAARHGRATTRRHWTACSTDRAELLRWCTEEYRVEPTTCEVCRTARPADERTSAPRLTRASRDVLDFVLDVAIIHLEPDAKPYRLTIGDVAHCLRKTTGQLSPAVRRLAEEQLILIEAPTGRRASFERSTVYPTPAGLRTLPFFADWTNAQLTAELAKLHDR